MKRSESSAERRLHDRVRRRYASVAQTLMPPEPPAGPGTVSERRSSTMSVPVLESGQAFGPGQYAAAVRSRLPQLVVAASLGCGDPVSRARLEPGNRVLDLGCGGGIDAILAACEVGALGHVVGLDLTSEMLAVAERGVQEAGVPNVSLVQAAIERLPFTTGIIDAVISNSVIHFSYDKPAVFREAHRVLNDRGSFVVVDLVADDGLSSEAQSERSDDVGWTTGALGRTEYQRLLEDAGFAGVTLDLLHPIADGMHAALISAIKRPASVGR